MDNGRRNFSISFQLSFFPKFPSSFCSHFTHINIALSSPLRSQPPTNQFQFQFQLFTMDDPEADLNLGDVFTVTLRKIDPARSCMQLTNRQIPPRPPSPEATTSTFIRERSRNQGYLKNNGGDGDEDWDQISIRLIGSHPLWGHYLYVDLNVWLR